jgi:cytochrome c553
MNKWTLVATALAIGALHILPAAAEPDDVYSKPKSTYLLGCGGCHGLDGVSNSKLVPELQNQVGYFLNLEAGRDYLVRVPNVAFSTLSDQDLADMLNFMVFTLGGSSAPVNAKRYTAGEVSRLRKQPLTEVSLVAYRKQLVEMLITQYHAPGSLRVYGNDDYASRTK